MIDNRHEQSLTGLKRRDDDDEEEKKEDPKMASIESGSKFPSFAQAAETNLNNSISIESKKSVGEKTKLQ